MNKAASLDWHHVEVLTQCTQLQVVRDLITVYCLDTTLSQVELPTMNVPRVVNVCSHLRIFLFNVHQEPMILITTSHASHVLKVKFVQSDNNSIFNHLAPEMVMVQYKLDISHPLELM